ncbi:hypothetical protein V8E36_000855, partial [Tilletia maclaganii]
PQLLGLQTNDRTSPISSDGEEGLASWTEKDGDRWCNALVQAQDETSELPFVADELLRWREHPRRSGYQYRVAWQGHPFYACTWESASSFDRKMLDVFWARKKGKPDFVPKPASDDEVISAHNSDSDFGAFHHLDPVQKKTKIFKKRTAWRRDKNDLRFVKQLRREERESRRLTAAAGGPTLSPSSSSAAPAPRHPQTRQSASPAPPTPSSTTSKVTKAEPAAKGKGKDAAPSPARTSPKSAPARTGPTADDEVVIISSDENDGPAPPPASKAPAHASD